jgi:outer membrane receptor protein involved in Fe transport
MQNEIYKEGGTPNMERTGMKKATLLVTMLLLGAFLLSGSGAVFAATTGKITGVIKDRGTNAPLVGTNVMVEGTSLGAVTESDGNFAIINCPPGIHTLRVTMMGYKRTIVKEVRVSIDLTTTVDVAMESTVIEGETVNIVSVRPMVRKDMTSSMAVVGADEIRNLPVDNIASVLALKAGVTTEANGTVHIRGGRGGEVAYWVDGVPMTTAGRSMGISVENTAVQELQVVSGTFNAEYGKAMSGIVNIVTKDGEGKLSGSLTGYVEDYASQDKLFGNLTGVKIVNDPASGALKEAGVYEYPLRSLKPSVPYDIQPVLSGDLFSFNDNKNKLSFFANARLRSWQGWEYGRRWFTPLGWPGDSSRVLLNENKSNNVMAKLALRLGANLNLKYQVMFDNGNGTGVNRSFMYTPDAKSHWKSERLTQMFMLNHVLSPKMFYEARFAYYTSKGTNYMKYDNASAYSVKVKAYSDTANGYMEDEVFDPIKEPERLKEAILADRQLKYFSDASCDYQVKVLKDETQGIMEDVFYRLDNEADRKAIKDAIDARRSIVYITDPNGPMGYVHTDSLGLPASYSFNLGGYPNLGSGWQYSLNKEAYWLGKWDLTLQADRANQVKLGLEAKRTKLFNDEYAIIPLNITSPISGVQEEVRPFVPAIPGDSTINRNTYTRRPMEFSAYVQDKIEVKDLVINIGFRYDYFDANAYIFRDPYDPNIYFPMKAENQAYKSLPVAERRKLMQKKTDPVNAVSPRLGFSFPITDRGIIHFCYGHFFAMPDLSLLYNSPDFKFSQGGGLTAFGNPTLKPERTVQYEIGLQQQLSATIGFDVTLFYKDIRDWAGSGPKLPTELPSITYSMMENKDYANVRGVTFSLTKRMANHFSANADYTFQYAEGTYTNPYDAFTALQNNADRRISLIPMGYDQRHTLTANVNYSHDFGIGPFSVTILGQYHTGNPYTPTYRTGESTGSSAAGSIPENSQYTPNIRNLDLYINQMFKAGSLRVGVFAKVYNLLDTRNVYGVYSDTGSPYYTTNPDISTLTYDPAASTRVGTAEEAIKNIGFFSGPRRIQVGMTIGF